MRFVLDEREPEALRTLMGWKSAQYRRTGRRDRFAKPWIRGQRGRGAQGVLQLPGAQRHPDLLPFLEAEEAQGPPGRRGRPQPAYGRLGVRAYGVGEFGGEAGRVEQRVPGPLQRGAPGRVRDGEEASGLRADVFGEAEDGGVPERADRVAVGDAADGVCGVLDQRDAEPVAAFAQPTGRVGVSVQIGGEDGAEAVPHGVGHGVHVDRTVGCGQRGLDGAQTGGEDDEEDDVVVDRRHQDLPAGFAPVAQCHVEAEPAGRDVQALPAEPGAHRRLQRFRHGTVRRTVLPMNHVFPPETRPM